MNPIADYEKWINEEKQDIENPLLEIINPDRSKVSYWLNKQPEPREYLFYNGEFGFLPKNIVGLLVATGGTGKSYLLAQLGLALAGGKQFEPLQSEKKWKVLMLTAEDDKLDVAHRLWDINGGGDFPDNFHCLSVKGIIKPLMGLSDGNPLQSIFFKHLEECIKNFDGLDVLILDPLSRFFGLSENSNEHQTAFIAALEELSVRYNLTILISHHTNKASSKDAELEKDASRGGAGLSDAIRWQLSARIMTVKNAQKFGLQNRWNFLEVAVTKTNNTAYSGMMYFQKIIEDGIFRGYQYVSLEDAMSRNIAAQIYHELLNGNYQLSIREINQAVSGKDFADIITDKLKCKRKDLKSGILYGIENNLFHEIDFGSGKKAKKILVIKENNSVNNAMSDYWFEK